MKQFKLLLLLSVVFLFSGCFEYEDIEFKGINNFKMGTIKDGAVNFDLDVTLFNPNGYAISVKPSEVEVYVEDDYIGLAKLLQKVKMKRKTIALYAIPLKLTLENGAMFKLMRYASKKEVTLNIKGKVKGAVLGVSKKIEVNEKKTISTKDFKL